MKIPFTKDVRLRFWSKVDIACPEQCWVWLASRTATGYGQFKPPGRTTMKAHRFAYELANGSIPQGDGYHGNVVMHSCDNPLCVNPAHLSLGTQTENLADMARKGRRKGESSPNSILTEDLVRFIKTSPRSARSIALELGICPRTAQRVRDGSRWAHIK